MDKLTRKIYRNSGSGAFILGADKKETPLMCNSYVKDGLIAMWDGKENAGYGVHDSTLAFSDWANLGSASCPLEYQDSNIGSRWQWGNDGADLIPGAAASPRSLSFTVPQNPNNNFTFDYCVAGGTASINNYYFNSYGQGVFRFFQEGTTTGQYVGGYGQYSVSPDITNASIVSDGSTLKGYWNGAAKTNLAYTFESGSETNMVLNILGSNFSSIQGSSMHCFRIYNRTLTPEEIAYNYNVDKRRFNLP